MYFIPTIGAYSVLKCESKFFEKNIVIKDIHVENQIL